MKRSTSISRLMLGLSLLPIAATIYLTMPRSLVRPASVSGREVGDSFFSPEAEQHLLGKGPDWRCLLIDEDRTAPYVFERQRIPSDLRASAMAWIRRAVQASVLPQNADSALYGLRQYCEQDLLVALSNSHEAAYRIIETGQVLHILYRPNSKIFGTSPTDAEIGHAIASVLSNTLNLQEHDLAQAEVWVKQVQASGKRLYSCYFELKHDVKSKPEWWHSIATFSDGQAISIRVIEYLDVPRSGATPGKWPPPRRFPID